MVCADLFSIGDKMPALLGVPCDGGTCDREFQWEIDFDGCVDDGVETEDLFFPVGILRVSANADASILIRRQLGAAKEEGVGLRAFTQDDAGDKSSFDDKIKTFSLQLCLKAEDLVVDAGFVGVGLLKTKGEDLHPRSWEIIRESVGRAVCLDANLLTHG